MKAFAVLQEWMRRRDAYLSHFVLGGKHADWSVSVSNFPPAFNIIMLSKLPSPVLSLVESYLGSKDKINLRATCKLLATELPQWELPLYRSHFMSKTFRTAAFLSTDHSIPSPLFFQRFSNYAVVERAKVSTYSHTLSRTCCKCGHHLPRSALTLPSLAHYTPDKPILPMRFDHNCFHAIKPTYGNVDPSKHIFLPYDAVYALNLIQFDSPTTYKSTIVLCCSEHCYGQVSRRIMESPTPVAVICQIIRGVQRLGDHVAGVELGFQVSFSKHLSIVADYSSTNMIVRKFRLRMENYHYRTPPMGNYTFFDFKTFGHVTLNNGMTVQCSKNWHLITEEVLRAPSVEAIKALRRRSYEMMLREGDYFPELQMDGQIYAEFLEHFNHISSEFPFIHVIENQEENEIQVVQMAYSFSAIIYNDGPWWAIEAYVHEFDIGRERIRALLRNLRRNLQLGFEGTAVRQGMAGVFGTLIRETFYIAPTFDYDAASTSSSDTSYEDLLTDEELDPEDMEEDDNEHENDVMQVEFI